MKNNGKNKTNLFDTKIENVCLKDDMSPVMQCVYIKGGFIYATNGHILTKQHLSLHGLEMYSEILEGKLIHKDVIKLCQKVDSVDITNEGIKTVKGRVRTMYEYETEAGRYPDADSIIPSGEGMELSKIAVNPELLVTLQGALIGSYKGGVKLQFNGQNKAIIVHTDIEAEKQIGIIMPIMLD